MDNSKIINQINQLFHNKGIKQDDRFNLLIELLEENKNGITNEKFQEIIKLINSFDYSNNLFFNIKLLNSEHTLLPLPT